MLSSSRLLICFHFDRSGGAAKAMFLRHEGFLGAMGAFLSSDKHSLQKLLTNQEQQGNPNDITCGVNTTQGPGEGVLNVDLTIECSLYAA